MKRFLLLVLPALILASTAVLADHEKRITVPSGSVGVARSGSTVLAEEGATVIARTGSTVLFWPGSTLSPLTASIAQPDCSKPAATAGGAHEVLVVKKGAGACAGTDTVVVALYGSTVLLEPGVTTVRRPVVRQP